ncbi:hypothetical protein Nepgr_008851 [Nepenthes gracilis]|uniref:G-patch domain-containing protein n=1 Tax=Nepenthes gracilis TaxID=150966 RepID=A0AAD3SAC3_NEPGR|nr:hypothetical protein Nepgr_008851 [Nepenthes gracilis]
MDEYQEMERFGMDNDFEDGQWLGSEFYYRKRKEKPLQTKDDVLFGVFASGSSDSDGEGFSSKKRRRGAIKKSDFTKPVNFVSTGTVMPNQEIDRNAKDEKHLKDNDDDGDDDDDYKPGLGTGAASSMGSGLGFISSLNKQSHEQPRKKPGVVEEGEVEEDEDSFLPTAFGRKIKEGAEQRRERSKLAANGKSEGARRSSEIFGGSSGVGSFEKHTKGIGLRLLEKMGYKGGGLGKTRQGIVAPIEAKMRPKNMGMGFNDYQEAKNRPILDAAQLELEEKQSEVKKKEKLWKKHTRYRAGKEYITAEELLAKKEEQGVESVFQKVVDMRGPQVRVLTNLENLNAEQKARESDIPMPELQHNIRLIVDLAELDIQEIDRKLRNERETVVALQQEKEKLQNEMECQKQQLDSMEEILRALDHISEENLSGKLTLDSLAKSFGDLKRRFAGDYKLCNLSSIACSYALPLFIRVFQGWDPLQNPSHGREVVSLWKSLLQGGENLEFSAAASPYAQLIMEVVFPAIRISGINTWQARDPEPMLGFLESWEELLPPSIRHSILEMIVMPKLSDAVDTWDPCRETIPIHVWVHPWLPLLGQKLETLYQAIRIKLEHALRAWHPSDSSAYTILYPWKTVFDPASWEHLIVRSILPKLYDVLQEFQVNPANQKLDQFDWVISWASAVPIHHMVTLLELHFFSKWQQVLYHWLSSNPKFEEVTEWYLGWKNLLPPDLLANERVRSHLTMGLDMMNRAVEGMEVVQPGLKENISYLRAREQRHFESQQRAAAFAQQQASLSMGAASQTDGVPEMSLKEVVEAHAQQHGLLFKPKPGRSYNGHQIYGFGNVSIIIDTLNQQVFAQSEEEWCLVSLEQMLHMQNISGSRRR